MTMIRAGVPINEALVAIIVCIYIIVRAPPTSPGPHKSRPLDKSRVMWSTKISVMLVRVTNTLRRWRAMGDTHTRRRLVDLGLGINIR